MEPEGSLLHSQASAARPSLYSHKIRGCIIHVTDLFFK